MLVIPYRQVRRLTDLTSEEVADIFGTVQKVQKMLAKQYFKSESEEVGKILNGSFNVALQDGPESGQTVPHVHVHIIPRPKLREGEEELGDGIYDRLQGEEGNVGGGLWDSSRRPVPTGKFPKIEESQREPRSKEVMDKEADFFRSEMEKVD